MSMFTENATTTHQEHLVSGGMGWKSRQQLTTVDWEIHKLIIHQMYITEQRTLENVMRIM